MMSSKWKTVLLSESNYKKLKAFGGAGDSFNDVVSVILKEREELLRR
jgi:hypothetical protein